MRMQKGGECVSDLEKAWWCAVSFFVCLLFFWAGVHVGREMEADRSKPAPKPMHVHYDALRIEGAKFVEGNSSERDGTRMGFQCGDAWIVIDTPKGYSGLDLGMKIGDTFNIYVEPAEEIHSER